MRRHRYQWAPNFMLIYELCLERNKQQKHSYYHQMITMKSNQLSSIR